MTTSLTLKKLKPWIIIFIASLYFFYHLLQLNMLSTLQDYFSARFDLHSGVALGNFSSLYFYGCLIFSIPAGLILDKYPTKIVLSITTLLYFFCSLLLLFSNNLMSAELARFFSGAAGAFAVLSCVKLANQWMPKKHIGKAISFCIIIGFFGGLAANYPLAVFYNHFGGQAFLKVNIAIIVIIFLLILLTIENCPGIQPVKNESKNSIFKSIPVVCKNYFNWIIGFYIGLLNLPVFLLAALWGIPYLRHVDLVPKQTAASIIGMIFIGSMFGMFFWGWLTDYAQKRKIPMIAGALASLTAMLSIIYLGKYCNELTLSILFFLIGFVTSAQVIGYAVLTDVNLSKYVAVATGAVSIILFACSAFSQILFGWIIDIFSYTTPEKSYNYAILLLPIGFVIAFILTLIIKESYPKEPEQTTEK